METYADLIGCEDVLLFANAAITSTGQREFHSAAGEQRLSLAFLHSYIHGNYPDLYAATLALDVNDHNLRRGQVPLGGEAGRAARAPVAAGRGRLHRGGGARARRRPQGVRDLPGAVRAAAVRGDTLAGAFVVPHPEGYRALPACAPRPSATSANGPASTTRSWRPGCCALPRRWRRSTGWAGTR
jgi:hypothetical protein